MAIGDSSNNLPAKIIMHILFDLAWITSDAFDAGMDSSPWGIVIEMKRDKLEGQQHFVHEELKERPLLAN